MVDGAMGIDGQTPKFILRWGSENSIDFPGAPPKYLNSISDIVHQGSYVHMWNVRHLRN